MNITFICDSYYPSKGGVQNVTKYLAEGLAKDKKKSCGNFNFRKS